MPPSTCYCLWLTIVRKAESMEIQKVNDAILNNFAEKGYEAASLSDIAKDLGIQKQSLATYYPNKKAMLTAVFNDVYERHMKVLDDSFDDNLIQREKLHEFLVNCMRSYSSSPDEKFWLRMVMFERDSLDEEMLEKVKSHDEAVKEKAHQALPKDQQAASAFVSLYDSMCFKLVEEGLEAAENQLEDAWIVYWRGVCRGRMS